MQTTANQMTFAIRHPLAKAVSIATLALSASAMAAPVTFSVTPDLFTPGSGYGSGITRLGVAFTTTGTPQSFSLSSGDSQTFQFGSIRLQDEGLANLFTLGALISPLEQDALGVSASFSFSNPFSGSQTVNASGIATLGFLADSAVDLVIDWNDVVVDFGNGGQFTIALNDLSFTANNQSRVQNATITLNSSPVPEPATMALLGIALAGLGVATRQQKKAR